MSYLQVNCFIVSEVLTRVGMFDRYSPYQAKDGMDEYQATRPGRNRVSKLLKFVCLGDFPFAPSRVLLLARVFDRRGYECVAIRRNAI